jgi:hypothetical protein
MAYEAGGMSEKLGNRYEGRWVAKQLLRLLNEEILSVTVELIGPEEEGVDLLVVKKDSVRQLQQCKARFGNQNSWSIKGILGHLWNHLSSDVLQEFVLVSSIPAQPFFDYLKRTYIELFPDDRNTWSDLLTWADFLLTGEPETAIDVLLAYAENHDKYRKPIYADELRAHLAEQYKIHPKNLQHDSRRIVPVIEELRQQFSESIRPGLIQGGIIPRQETQQIIKCIESGQDVILHGAAGYGKSGILFELSEHLNQAKIPFLAVRLDRRIPDKTAKQFGADMGLPESLVYSLAGLVAGRKSFLMSGRGTKHSPAISESGRKIHSGFFIPTLPTTIPCNRFALISIGQFWNHTLSQEIDDACIEAINIIHCNHIFPLYFNCMGRGTNSGFRQHCPSRILRATNWQGPGRCARAGGAWRRSAHL